MPEAITIASDNYLKFASQIVSPGLLIPEKLAVQRIHGGNAYTCNPRVDELRGVMAIKTAFYLGRMFPEVLVATDKMFGRALGGLVAHAGLRAALHVSECIPYMQSAVEARRWFRIGRRVMSSYIRAKWERAVRGRGQGFGGP